MHRSPTTSTRCSSRRTPSRSSRFRWRGRDYQVAAADGPERVYGEWWRRAAERETVRDYFQVEAKDGARFWLFRAGDGEDPASGDVSWYLHGVFG